MQRYNTTPRAQRRLFTLLVMAILLFSSPACAADYVSIDRLYEEVQSGWHESYDVNGDVITIDLDDILIPEASALPFLSVSPAARVDDSLLSGYQVGSNAANALLYSTGELSSNRWWNGSKMNYGESASFYPHDIKLDMHADDNSLSLGDAIGMVAQEVTRLYGEDIASSMQLRYATVFSKAYYLEKHNSPVMSDRPVDQPDNIGFYAMTFDQAVHGVPIIGIGGGDYEYLKNDAYTFTAGVDSSVHAPDAFHLSACFVLENTIQHDDIPILSFEDIKAVLEGLIHEGKIRSITDMRLGYYLYCDPAQQDINWLVPMWVARGDMHYDPDVQPLRFVDENGQVEYETVSTVFEVEAQSGKIIDFLNMSPSRRHVPDILSWDDVN